MSLKTLSAQGIRFSRSVSARISSFARGNKRNFPQWTELNCLFSCLNDFSYNSYSGISRARVWYLQIKSFWGILFFFGKRVLLFWTAVVKISRDLSEHYESIPESHLGFVYRGSDHTLCPVDRQLFQVEDLTTHFQWFPQSLLDAFGSLQLPAGPRLYHCLIDLSSHFFGRVLPCLSGCTSPSQSRSCISTSLHYLDACREAGRVAVPSERTRPKPDSPPKSVRPAH